MDNSKFKRLIIFCLVMLLAFNAAAFAFAEEEGGNEGEVDPPEPTVIETEPPATQAPTPAPTTHAPVTTKKPHVTQTTTKKPAVTGTTRATSAPTAERTTTTERNYQSNDNDNDDYNSNNNDEQVYNRYTTSPSLNFTEGDMDGITIDDDDKEEEQKKEDYSIDLKKTEKSLNGEFGYFGPYTSDDIVGMGSESGLIFDTKVIDGYVGFDFDPARCAEIYNYLVLTLRSTDDSVVPAFTLTVGNVTKPFTEWILENGSKPEKAIPQIFTDYIIDLEANGVDNLLNEDYDFVMKNSNKGTELITVMGMTFTDNNPGGKKVKLGSKTSLVKKIIIPVVLIVLSLGVIVYVNFFFFKRKKFEDSKVKSGNKNVGKNGRYSSKNKPYNSSQRSNKKR